MQRKCQCGNLFVHASVRCWLKAVLGSPSLILCDVYSHWLHPRACLLHGLVIIQRDPRQRQEKSCSKAVPSFVLALGLFVKMNSLYCPRAKALALLGELPLPRTLHVHCKEQRCGAASRASAVSSHMDLQSPTSALHKCHHSFSQLRCYASARVPSEDFALIWCYNYVTVNWQVILI